MKPLQIEMGKSNILRPAQQAHHYHIQTVTTVTQLELIVDENPISPQVIRQTIQCLRLTSQNLTTTWNIPYCEFQNVC